MSLTYPLSLAVFVEALKITTQDFDLSESSQIMETGGGEVIGASHGTRLWGGSLTLADAVHRDQSRAEALIQALRVPGRRFEIGDMSRRYPAADPTGAIFAASTPTLVSATLGGTLVMLSGLPPGYLLTTGDYFSFADAGGVQQLHRVVSDAYANGSGVAGGIDVVPAIRPAGVGVSPVRFIRPFMRAALVPTASALGQRRPMITAGASFSFRQSLRG